MNDPKCKDEISCIAFLKSRCFIYCIFLVFEKCYQKWFFSGNQQKSELRLEKKKMFQNWEVYWEWWILNFNTITSDDFCFRHAIHILIRFHAFQWPKPSVYKPVWLNTVQDMMNFIIHILIKSVHELRWRA